MPERDSLRRLRGRTLGPALLAILTIPSLGAGIWQTRVTGLRLVVQPSGGTRPLEIRAPEVTSDVLLLDPAIPPGITGARWDGYWLVPGDGPCALLLKGREPARVWIDDILVFERDGAEPYRDEKTLSLGRGSHPLRAEFQVRGPLPVFKLFLTSAGNARPAEGGRELSPVLPSQSTERLLPLARLLRRATLAAWVLALLWTACVLCRRGALPLMPVALATLVVLYAGGLRLEAVVREYWGMDAPGWARRIASLASPLRPNAMKLSPIDHPYTGDPGAYLRFAREMEHFYGAHVREPLFVFAAKVGLAATGGADVGISLTSAVFSTLLVWGTYLLGSSCLGPRVGLLAALLMAIEPVAVSLGADGWRDDAFSFFVVLSTLSLSRLQAAPTTRRGVRAGLAGAAACLTRMTSVSFLLPASLVVWLDGEPALSRSRLRALGLALLVTMLLVAPYLVTCTLVFGDPFISVNAHTQFYRTRANLAWDSSMTWFQYLTATFRPLELVQNMMIGLTAYPFDNKWNAYDVWIPHAAVVLRLLAVAGLALFVRRREGRLLLVVLVTALIPFAFTWRVAGGSEWRFTLHAYPFYLLAVAHVVDEGLAVLWSTGNRLRTNR
ncbi:MAG: glycosyltransferase family 39 protein [Vicinamibacteria bacterium]